MAAQLEWCLLYPGLPFSASAMDYGLSYGLLYSQILLKLQMLLNISTLRNHFQGLDL